eukprot:2067728-Rhodomonas_salina.2
MRASVPCSSDRRGQRENQVNSGKITVAGECPAGKASLEQANLCQRGRRRHPCAKGISRIKAGQGQHVPICLDRSNPGGSVSRQTLGIRAHDHPEEGQVQAKERE